MKHVFMNKENGKIASVLAMYLDDEGHMQTDSYDKVEDLLADYAALERAPKEPLIKDEKIRKAIRAWAEANDMGEDSVVLLGKCDNGFSTDTSCVEFDDYLEIDKLEHGKYYTIDELCGEEEE